MKSRLNRNNFFVVLVCVAALGLTARVAKGRTITVRLDGTGDYTTIQDAIDDCNDGDEVVVADGTYTGPGNRDIDFLGKAITVRSTDPNDPNVVSATVIDCQGFEMDRHRGFNFVSGEDGNSILDGLTITGGYAPEEEFEDEFGTFRLSVGGAIFCYGSSPSITRCRIVGNRANGSTGWGSPPPPSSGAGGGGIGCRESEANISNCTISNNSASSGEYTSSVGGGIYFSGGGGVITNCTISNNSTTGGWSSSGGIFASGCNITNCTVSRNSCSGGGGGIGARNCTISNCMVTENSVYSGWPAAGGGISAGSCKIDSCTISNNTAVSAAAVANPWTGYCPNGAPAYGGGVYLTCEPNGASTITNCTVYGNTAKGGSGGVRGTGTPPSGDGTDGGNGYGGGIFYYGCECESLIENCIVLNNSVSGGAGGRWHWPWPWHPPVPWPGTPGNPGNGYGAGICTNSENMLIRHCIVRGGEADYGQEIAAVKCSDNPSYVTVCYCDIEGLESSTYAADDCTVYWGLGNIDVEPMLTLDAHLRADSPCINAGDPNYSPGPEETDIDGEPRGYDGIVDIGIDEFIDSDGDGLPDWWEQKYFASPTAANPGDDPDGDGFDNLKEYHISSDPLVPGANYYIDPNEGDDAWDGLSPEWDGTHGPKATIQAAINVAEDADKIILAAGTYTGEGNRDIDFLGKIIIVRSTDPDNPAVVAATVIDCQGTYSEPHRGFNFHSGEGPDSILAGVTITNGYGPRYEWVWVGGAIFCNNSSPTIIRCRIESNSAAQRGGGIYCTRSSPTITNCLITNNRIEIGGGGGIYCDQSDPNITNCTINNNYGSGISCHQSDPNINNCIINSNTAGDGGGINYGWESSPNITNCTITNNKAESGGGICGDWEGRGAITNCIISGNRAQRDGGGLYGCGPITNCIISDNIAEVGGGLAWCSSPVINCVISNNTAEYGGGFSTCYGPVTNCIISGNVAEDGGGLAACRGPITNCTITTNRANGRYGYGGRGGGLNYCDGEITNCILWDNWPEQIYGPAPVGYSNIEGGWEGEGNIDAEPVFALTTDYHLMPGSPCIDAGTNDPCDGLPTADKEGVLRPLDGDGDGNDIADMGAYEYAPDSPSIAVSALSFYFVQDWPRPEPQTLLIRNCGDQPLQWEIVEDCSWLEAAPANGISTGQINEVTITVDPNGLTPGYYICTLEVQDANASNSPVSIQVAMPVGLILPVPSQNFPTIQSAIDQADNYDVVLVADGNYTGPGNKNLDFNGKAITVKSENGPNNCIIDCQNSGEGFYFQNGEREDSVVEGFTITNGRIGVFCIFESDSSPTITNCTISNNSCGIYCDFGSNLTITNCTISGNGGGAWHEDGGIYCWGGSQTITNCTIRGNDGAGITCGSGSTVANCTISANSGGGIRCASSTITNCTITGNSTESGGGVDCHSGTIVNSTISNNSAGLGGGIYCSGGSPTITNCTITGNSAQYIGGVWCDSELSPTIANCIISNNSADIRVGGISFAGEDGNPIITNCTISGNSANEGDAGLSCWGGDPTITNCTITGNTAGEYAGGFSCYYSSPIITNCIIWANEAPDGPQIYVDEYSNASVSYTDVQGDQNDIYIGPDCTLNWGLGNIDLDPWFVSPGYWDTNDFWVDGDYHLLEDSPCIDAGDPNYIAGPDETDLDGNPRIVNGIVDMGAFEAALLGPVELLAGLTQDVIDLNLHRGIANSLLAKLDTALQKLEDANEKNDIAAINSLQAFINAIEAQRGKKIPEADADALIAKALEIIELLSAE